MTTSSGFHAADIANTTAPLAASTSGSELVNKFISYYSDSETPPSHELVAAVTTPVSAVSASSTITSVSQMRPYKISDDSSTSTDTEHNGNGSSESSSSLGDSAAAAARVLAAWQDRAGITGSTAAAAAAIAAVAGSGSAANAQGIWPVSRTPGGRLQSTMSTPRHSHATFDHQPREGSAPVPGASDAGQRRPDMGFLALLNNAAAFIAESSGTSSDTNTAAQQQSEHSQQFRQHQQNQNVDNSYLTHSELISNANLTLSGINNGFGRMGPGGGPGNDQGGFSTHYGAPLTNSAYQDLAQALQHIAATTAGADGGMLSAVVGDTHNQTQFGTQHEYVADSGSMSAATVAAVAAAAAAAVSGSIRPDHIMVDDHQYAANDDITKVETDAVVMPVSAGMSKRKRKDGNSTPHQSPAKRKSSQASDRSAKTTPHPDIRRAARKWTEEETESLLRGCSKYGVGAWKKILDDPTFVFNCRTSVDLKDRFRTIRAQECAQSPYPKNTMKSNGKEPDVVWPLPPNSQRLQGLQRVQRKPTRNYTHDEDRRLLLGVLRHANHWTKIAADADLKLNDRPGQSLRDRLRNAFPEVFELFGYVIPKKERADRERHLSPGAQAKAQPEPVASIPKRKAPTGSKRLEGDIPGNIRDKIMSVLSAMNASLDPHPITDDDDDIESSYDADADADGDRNDMGADSVSLCDSQVHHAGGDSSAASMVFDTPTSAGRQRSSSQSKQFADCEFSGDLTGLLNEREGEDELPIPSAKNLSSRKKPQPKRPRAKSKAALANQEKQNQLGALSVSGEGSVAGGVNMGTNDSDIHSAPAHVNSASCSQLAALGSYTDVEQRRSGTVSAGPFGSHRNFLFDSFAPSVFSRPLGSMTPTDQLDALALEGRGISGYSTPTHSAKRRHSVQADFNDVMAAAADAAGIDRSNFSSALQFFHPGVTGLEHAANGAGGSAMQLSAADTIRRMTIGGPINPDAFLFPRLPDEAAAAAAAAAAVADISAQMSSAQSAVVTPGTDGNHMSGMTASAATAINVTTGGSSSTDSRFKHPSSSSAESAIPTLAPMSTVGSGAYLRDNEMQASGQRGQLRSAQRLLRANGVADDNSIGLSTTSTGDGRVDFDALTQLTQWFPNFPPSGLGWNIGDAGGQMGGESIDPNMLDAGLASATIVGTAGTAGSNNVGDINSHHHVNGGGAGGLSLGNELTMTHARRRSQFDWYGLTPSLLAQLDAASATVVAQAATDTNTIASLNPYGISQGSVNQQSYRRPSMPIFPTFAYPTSDMLGITGTMQHQQQAGDSGHHEQDMYNVSSQDTAAGMTPMNMGDTSEAIDTSTIGFSAAAAAAAAGLGNKVVGAYGSQLSVGGNSRSRVASGPGRRRTMHVPPSLLEDVATSEFNDSAMEQVPKQQQQQTGGSVRKTGPYPPRPSGTKATTRVRRSRTIGSNQNIVQLAVDHNSAIGVPAQQSQASPSSALLSVSEAATGSLSSSSSHLQLQFPLLSTQLDGRHAQQQQQQSIGLGLMDSANSTGSRHARTFSGTQFTQDAMNALASVPGGLMNCNPGSSGSSSNMDVDLEAMTSLGSDGAAMDLSSFKPSMWTSSLGFGDDDSQLG
ncbi:hypothetical protein LPJ66_004997, partial [Kickxella alabastrina]